MTHLTETDILKYAFDEASEAEQIRIEEHVADCSDCRGRVQAAVYVKTHAGSLVESWSAEEHGAAFRQMNAIRAMRAIALKDRTLAARAAKWLTQTTTEVAASARLLIDQAKSVGLSAMETGSAGWSASLRPALQGVASPTAEAAYKYVEEGSGMLSQGSVDDAIRAVSEAVNLDSRIGQSTTLEMRHTNGAMLQLVVDSKRRRAILMHKPARRENIGGLAILMPLDWSQDPMVSKLEAVEDADYLIAEFDGLPDGQYTLIVEPPARLQ